MANDFSQDVSCISLWRFESGALVADSKGSNPLTPVNGPTEDLVNFREGACAAALARASSQYFTIPDASLPADFPFKNGGSSQSGTFLGWFRFTSTNADQGLLGKLRCAGSCGVFQYYGQVYLDWNNGWQATGIPLDVDIWYHIAVRMDAAGSSNVRVYRASDGQVFNNSKTDWSVLTPGVGDFRVGSFADGVNTLNGLVDEVPVFCRLLSDAEVDEVRAETYARTFTPSMKTSQVAAQVEYAGPPNLLVHQALAQVEYTETAPKIIAYQVSGQVEIGSAPERRVFPIPHPNTAWQTQGYKRVFPVVV